MNEEQRYHLISRVDCCQAQCHRSKRVAVFRNLGGRIPKKRATAHTPRRGRR
jgi:hypothetical protein